MFTLRIPVNTHAGLPLTSSPTFRDLADYIHDRLVAERLISLWDRAVRHSGTCILVRTPSQLPEHLVEWAVAAAREFYAPLSLGTPVQEETSDLGAAIVLAAGVAAAAGAPGAKPAAVGA